MNFDIPEKFKNLDWNFIAEELCEAICGNGSRVQLTNHDKTDAINSVGSAVFNDENGEEIVGFNFRNGNWSGTEIFDIDGAEYKPPKPIKRTFVPDFSKIENKEMAIKIYDHWKEQDWFKKKVSDMNYDMFFEPTNKTKKHYAEWASGKSMRIDIEAADE